ncbi:type II toxin-antitoxin system VapC family toxin [Sphingomonas suaedae]|uniref:Type II toxin-antitoxin system VapC family toxin n=1 Tax=Sphingomonas suaedae TaxID=2599297 RepID=A0A518RDQ1_9SPHN|nr:type II toxin-antitoxin system VapC family toxin [Sphingomonas suaedae]QDX25569.1 type II toxin-antitoxin system VapC family toxin [Sphingomonas suaedae]
MIFLDSNAVIDLMNQPSSVDRGWAARLFDRYANDVGLGANLIVVSEVAVGVQQPNALVDDMGQLGIEILDLTPPVALRAAAAFREYRRRGGPRSTILPDFLIGAHATVLGATLMTRDQRLASYFPELTFLTPETEHG